MSRRGPNLRARDVDAISRELAPAMAKIQSVAAQYGLTVGTIIKHVKLQSAIRVLPVPVKGLDDWNERIANQ